MQYNAVLTLLEVTRYKQFLCDTNSNFQRNQLANLFYKPENWSKMNPSSPPKKKFLHAFWNKILNFCTPQSSVVPISNNKEEDKSCFSFWISRQ